MSTTPNVAFHSHAVTIRNCGKRHAYVVSTKFQCILGHSEDVMLCLRGFFGEYMKNISDGRKSRFLYHWVIQDCYHFAPFFSRKCHLIASFYFASN